MRIYKTTSGQTIYDISLQLYGSEDRTSLILENNPFLDINSEIARGTRISYNEEKNDFSTFVRNESIDVNTGDSEIEEGKGFDNGFNIGFN